MKNIIITGTGTGIGKTYVTAMLARQLREAGEEVLALKPIITGWDESEATDTRILMKASGMSDVEKCSPWRFKAPLSPDMAAAMEEREIDFGELVTFCNQPFSGTKLIEGAGGIMSPVGVGKSFLDLVKLIPGQVILVTGSYLGSISHTLSALEVLHGRDVEIIINQCENSEVSCEQTAASLQNFTTAPITTLKRNAVLSF